MKKRFLFLLPAACLLFSCSSASSGDSGSLQTPGEFVTFTAASLSLSPSAKEQSATIEGHVFTYYNVYKDNEDNFILKDATSYIRNYDITFGLRFGSKLAVAYDLSKGKDGSSPCEVYYETEEAVSYTVSNGFEIALDKSASTNYADVNIGKIVHWC